MTVAQLKEAFWRKKLLSREHFAVMDDLFVHSIAKCIGNLDPSCKYLPQEKTKIITEVIKAFPEIVLDVRYDRSNEDLERNLVQFVAYELISTTKRFPELISIIQQEWFKLITPRFSHSGLIAIEYFDPCYSLAKPLYQDQEFPEPYYPLIPIVKQIAESKPATSYGNDPYVVGVMAEMYYSRARSILECYRRYFKEVY